MAQKLAPKGPHSATFRLLASAFCLLLPACRYQSHAPSATPAPTHTSPATAPVVSPQLRAQLSELLKGHDDKVQLAWYISSPLHKVDPAVLAFSNHMYHEQKRLRQALENWARKNHCDLKFKFTDDLAGHARKAMEDAQGDKLQHDDNADFQRDVLVMMELDFAQQKTLAAELLKVAPDDELRAYLTDCIKTHDAEMHEAQALLRRYHYQ